MEKLTLIPAFVGLEIAFILQIYQNVCLRNEMYRVFEKNEDLESGEGSKALDHGLLGFTGLTTIFNALT